MNGLTPIREGTIFGDTPLGTKVALCMYDGNSLFAGAVVANGVQWQAISDKGFKYKDKTGSESGVQSIKLQASPVGNPKEGTVVWKGKGENLPDPALPLANPQNFTTQVVTGNGYCASKTFTSTTQADRPQNNPTKHILKAK